MPFAIHTVEVPDGGLPNNYHRVILGTVLGVANLAGGSNGTAVTTAVAFPAGALPANYQVVVTPSQACMVSVSAKTTSGFNVTLTPLATVTLASGTFDLTVHA